VYWSYDVMCDVCSDEFIKAYDDVMALEKSLQKLRSSLNESLDKLHLVSTYLLAYSL